MDNFLRYDLKLDDCLHDPGEWCIAEVNISGWQPVDSRRWPRRERAAAEEALKAFQAERGAK